jgi:glycosyltransferase involved in cell wall biosynthesis
MPASSESRSGEAHATRSRRRFRVLHVILVAGETNSQYNQHCLPMKAAHDVSICTYFKPRLTPPDEIALFPGNDTLRGFFRSLRRALRAKDYDVIHAHAPHTGTLVTLGLAVQPRRWHLRRKLVYTVRDSFHDYKPRNKLLMLPALALWPRVVFCGQAAYESYPRAWRQLAGRRARTVQNAADLERVERAIGGLERRRDGTFTVLSIGRLEAVKDPMTLLASFERIDDDGSRMAFIGAGSLAPVLAKAVRARGLEERVELTGLIPREEVFARCAEADLFVSASRGEGLPVAVIEAMATGCPVVLSDIPPHREIANGVDFIPFIAPGDSEGFARELDRMRAMSPSERSAIGLKCRELARSRFSLPRMHAAYEEIYRELT